MVTQQDLIQFFCRAMLVGYAGGNEPTPDTTEPGIGWKYHDYYEGKLALRDKWLARPGSDFSTGYTTIYLESVPVWYTSYSGWYRASAIAFLRAAMTQNYEQGVFLGGRGPDMFTQHPLAYRNSSRGEFSDFHGIESVWNIETQCLLGKHWYRGSRF